MDINIPGIVDYGSGRATTKGLSRRAGGFRLDPANGKEAAALSVEFAGLVGTRRHSAVRHRHRVLCEAVEHVCGKQRSGGHANFIDSERQQCANAKDDK